VNDPAPLGEPGPAEDDNEPRTAYLRKRERACSNERDPGKRTRPPHVWDAGASPGRPEHTRRLPRRAGPPGQSAFRAQSVPPPVQDTRWNSGFPVFRRPLSCLWVVPVFAG